jgi:ATP-dependent 26S proteasome regulatory subunit
LGAALRSHGRSGADIDAGAVSAACIDFTGSEIAALVPEALFAAFAEDARAITTADLVAAARNVTPLAKTASDKIAKLREWSKGRARPATTATVAAPAGGRVLDF